VRYVGTRVRGVSFLDTQDESSYNEAMHISLNLPQFLKKRTLLLVTDKEHAKFFLASNGELTELAELAIHPVQELGRGQKKIRTLRRRQGALVDSPRGLENAFHAFAKKVSAAALKLLQSKKYSQIYLFGPHHYQRELQERLHSYVKAKIVRVYSGDFIHDHPLELLRRAKELPE
jgi:hypothetical protein